MNPLDLLFGQIAKQIQNHASPDTPGPSYDSNEILNVLGGIFGQHAQQDGRDFGGYNQDHDYAHDDNYGDVAPASQDPFGDPADSGGQGSDSAFGDVRPASEDPFGDPADQEGGSQANHSGFGDVRPSSEDPYGDPADR